MKRIYLVTGAFGHLGNTIVKDLVQAGETVRVLALPEDSSKSLEGFHVKIFRGSVCSIPSLIPFFHIDEPCEKIVIHCAGIVSIATKYDQKVYNVNVVGTKNIIKMCMLNKIDRLVHVSSVHALPELSDGQIMTEISSFSPDKLVGLYAKTKAEATQAVLDSTKRGLNAIVVHPSGILGPGDYGRAHLTQLVVDYMNGKLTACIDGGYDFVDVRDVAKGVISAASLGKSGECYLLTNQFYSITGLLSMLHEISGHKAVKTILPASFAKFTAPLAELYYKILHQPPLYTRYSLYTLKSNAKFSHEKADRELGYTTRSMKTTLTDTVDWLRQCGRIS